METMKEKMKTFKSLDWLQLNPELLSGKILSAPDIASLGTQINTQLIVEHYSRT